MTAERWFAARATARQAYAADATLGKRRQPGKATENSPAFQRWVRPARTKPVPSGTTEVPTVPPPFCRPCRDLRHPEGSPSVETLGYSPSPFRAFPTGCCLRGNNVLLR